MTRLVTNAEGRSERTGSSVCCPAVGHREERRPVTATILVGATPTAVCFRCERAFADRYGPDDVRPLVDPEPRFQA